ncbi:MAG TPA: single-stranded DNA-binding protein [Clostridiales bacterium]|jgi:single-strand DNA-binding protein|nr:single-stranded DNA-binding protein [Clostridiales bacterium]HBL82407.1 single-stranded DNA-binding protein [Clostridiales bacterium]
MNRWIGAGRLTKDPELRETATGTPVCNFTVAVARRFVREGQPEADFIPCITFGKSAEFVAKYFEKGKMIILEGSIQTRSWEDDEGQRHYMTECIADRVEFGGGKSESTSSDAPAEKTKTKKSGKQKNDDPLPDPEEEEDLPF